MMIFMYHCKCGALAHTAWTSTGYKVVLHTNPQGQNCDGPKEFIQASDSRLELYPEAQ